MRIVSSFIYLLACSCLLWSCQQKAEKPVSPTLPNIIFILADDMGYGDIQALNPSSDIPTPYLNQLAQEGMSFIDAHTPSAVCTPTRYGLITGRYCWRTRLKRGVQNGYGKPLIENSRTTLGSFLKRAGYHTGIIGKWHLGLDFTMNEDSSSIDFGQAVKQGPHTLGFDESFVIPASLDFPPYVYIHNGKITQIPDSIQPKQNFPAYLREGEISADFNMENCLDNLLDKSLNYIEAQSKTDKPFFLYFPLTAPHKPVLPHTRFRGKTTLGPYGDFVTQVDWTVGQVMKKLDELGIGDHTLLVYSSDNGSFMHRRDESEAQDHVDDETIQAYRSDRHTSNYVFRGTKADIWEGGHHVPFLLRWPEKVAPSLKVEEPICLTDFMSTVADIVSQPLREEEGPDSYSFLPLIEQRPTDYMRPPIVHHSANGTFGIRQGKWKLVMSNGSGGREQPRGKPFEKPYGLYNLSQDFSEKKNVIEKQPQVAAQLEEWYEEIANPSNEPDRQD